MCPRGELAPEVHTISLIEAGGQDNQGEMNMERDETNRGEALQLCRGRQAQAVADAKAIGLEAEFEAGLYSRKQISEWAGEQWLAWLQATVEDRRATEADRDTQEQMVPVKVRSARKA